MPTAKAPARYWFPKRYSDRVARLRVTFGFLLAVLFAWLSKPDGLSLLIGIPVSLLGLALRAWAAGHLRKDRQLTQSGPYRWTRNPLYLGTALVACGLVISGRSFALAIIFAAVFGLIYLPAIELEEQHLRDLFGEYEGFAVRVPRLVGIPRGPVAPGREFSGSLYRHNREYQAFIGWLAGTLLLIAKWLWWR